MRSTGSVGNPILELICCERRQSTKEEPSRDQGDLKTCLEPSQLTHNHSPLTVFSALDKLFCSSLLKPGLNKMWFSKA